jgi:hypothetical protein
VPIVATDTAGHARKADRSAIAARFLPEGAANRDAASLVLTPAIVQAMASGLVAQAGDVDVADEIRAMPTLSSDAQCTTWPTGATQDQTQVTLALHGAALELHIQVPNLDVTFDGECQGPLRQIPISGEMSGTIDVTTTLTAMPGAPCVSAFAHAAPAVSVSGWQFDVWGTGGPLQDWLVSLLKGQKGPQAEAQLQAQVGTRADQLLTQKLANVAVLDKTSTVSLLGKPSSMHLCLAALEPAGASLVARVAVAATGQGDAGAKLAAPGAPLTDGAVVAPHAKELVLDASVVAQLLFGAWRDGGLVRANVKQIDLGLITALARDLQPMFPDGGTADVSIAGELPPVVRASTIAGADLHVELGDLMLTIRAQDTELFRFGVHLTLELALEPQGGALVPKVVSTTSEVSLLGEIVDGPDEALEQAVQSQLGDAAAQLLGGAAITLPDVPGLGAPKDVTPDPGGRYVRVTLE